MVHIYSLHNYRKELGCLREIFNLRRSNERKRGVEHVQIDTVSATTSDSCVASAGLVATSTESVGRACTRSDLRACGKHIGTVAFTTVLDTAQRQILCVTCA